jgi:hypothetical protein
MSKCTKRRQQVSVFLKKHRNPIRISAARKKQTDMPDTDCPPAWEILSYLFCIILSVAMIWYIHLAVNFWNTGAIPLYAIFAFIWFCIIIWYAAVQLVLLLLPGRKETCPVCCLLAKIIEID